MAGLEVFTVFAFTEGALFDFTGVVRVALALGREGALLLVAAGAEPTIRHVATAGADFTSTHSVPVHVAPGDDDADAGAATIMTPKPARTTAKATEKPLSTFRDISFFSFSRTAARIQWRSTDSTVRTILQGSPPSERSWPVQRQEPLVTLRPPADSARALQAHLIIWEQRADSAHPLSRVPRIRKAGSRHLPAASPARGIYRRPRAFFSRDAEGMRSPPARGRP